MSYVLRTWACLNRKCGAAFESGEANPSCPHCRCVRVNWVPGGGHVGGVAAGVDIEVRKLAEAFGLTDLNSAERGRAAKKIAPQRPTNGGGAMMTFGGFTANVDPSAGAQCLPTVNKINFKTKAPIGQALPPSTRWGRPTPVVEARHNPQKNS